MSPSEWIAFGTLIVSGLGGGGLLGYRLARKKDEVAGKAQVISAEAQLISSQTPLINVLMARIKVLEDLYMNQQAECDEKIEALNQRIAAQDKRILQLEWELGQQKVT